MNSPDFYIGMFVGMVLVVAIEVFIFCILMMAAEECEKEENPHLYCGTCGRPIKNRADCWQHCGTCSKPEGK